MSEKLTKAQERELKLLVEDGGETYYADNYAPIKRLHELGYVSKKPMRFNSMYAATDKGRAALKGAIHD